jgi:hypothetical protein
MLAATVAVAVTGVVPFRSMESWEVLEAILMLQMQTADWDGRLCCLCLSCWELEF